MRCTIIEGVGRRTGARLGGADGPSSGALACRRPRGRREADAWFTYYYWLDDARAPDFARTVAIHHKPGYDPVELFLIRHPVADGVRRMEVAKKRSGSGC
jgi:hypothetical protein